MNLRRPAIAVAAGLVVFLSMANPGRAADRQVLYGHIPPMAARLQTVGQLSGTNQLELAIGLPLRNEAGLDNLLRQIYDPASTNFHKFLKPAEFAERFGPAEADYQAVEDFVSSNGLVVTRTYSNRVVLDIQGRVADVERALNVTLRTYRHPSEARNFFAPDTEPSLPANLRVTSIDGLSDYSLPRRADTRVKATEVRPLSFNGSGPYGEYAGNDFRNAYVPGTTLTGVGQSVALLEYSDYYKVDITNYENVVGAKIGTTNYVPLMNVVVGGTVPDTANNGEVALDIEMAIAMAPKLSKVIVYEKSSVSSSMLNQIATDNLASQVSSSWSVGNWSSSMAITYDNILKNMAAQGQSYFQSSGDSDAYTGSQTLDSGITVPLDSPYATIVGGTTLTMSGSGKSWLSETVWNYNLTGIPNEGSGGGTSLYYPIPSWQTNVNMGTNGGSSTHRNIPDVALTADNIFVSDNNGDYTGTYYSMGTSAAAPLWAGFCALANQQSAAATGSPVGFLNPALYTIGTRSTYSSCFHDIATGNNIGTHAAGLYNAIPGYDLCTGWGTPNGINLINALVGLDVLVITPASGFVSSGASGGPFTITSQTFTLTNSSGSSLNWQIGNTSAWLNVSSASGTLPAGGQNAVTIGLNASANSLVLGTYTATVGFTNRTSGSFQNRQFRLQVVQTLAVSPTNGFNTIGPVGGPFNVVSQNLALTNVGAGSLSWSIINTSVWLNVSPTSGILPANGSSTVVVVGLNSVANSLAAGVYTASLRFTNQTTHTGFTIPFVLQVGQSIVQNGGFEAGNFSFWTLANDYYSRVDHNGAISGIAPDAGSYLAILGDSGMLGTLSQTLPTVANQSYVLSLWLDSPNASLASGGQATNNIPNEFKVSWSGNVLFDQVNIGQIGWTNLQFIVTATGSNTVLQFGERMDTWYLGLDEVSAVPIPYPSFRSVTKVSGSNAVAFSWNAMAGFKYQVQYLTNLTTTNWITVSTNTAIGPVLTVTNGFGTDPQRYYRIRRLP